jgi:hypothetical protein
MLNTRIQQAILCPSLVPKRITETPLVTVDTILIVVDDETLGDTEKTIS